MDTAALNLLPTGTYKLHPPLIVNMLYMYESKWIRCGKLCDVGGPASGLSAYRQPYMGWRSQVPTHFLSIKSVQKSLQNTSCPNDLTTTKCSGVGGFLSQSALSSRLIHMLSLLQNKHKVYCKKNRIFFFHNLFTFWSSLAILQ